MRFILFGILMLVISVQFSNAFSFMIVTLLPLIKEGIVTSPFALKAPNIIVVLSLKLTHAISFSSLP